MRKSLIVLSLMLVFGMLLSACQPAAAPPAAVEEEAPAAEEQATAPAAMEEGAKKSVALGMYFRRDEWWQDLEKTAKETAESNGFEFLVADADGDSATQLQQIETFVSQDVSAIVFAPVDVTATADAIAEAHQKGIKVVCIELCLEDLTNVDAWAQFDQVKAGYDLGVLAGKFLNDNYAGEGKVAVLWEPGNLVHQMRYEGWKKGLSETAPNAVYVAEQDGQSNRDVSMAIAENVLTANPDTQIWYPMVEEMAFGVIAALDAANVDPASVAVFTEGWGQETLDNMAGDKPYLKGAIITPSTILARNAVQAVADFYNDGKPFTKEMKLATDVVTPENAVEYFTALGYTAQ
jgi:ribose transport system substrate-binding protein